MGHHDRSFMRRLLPVGPAGLIFDTRSPGDALSDRDDYPGTAESMLDGFARVPLGRPSEPGEVANVLASDAGELHVRRVGELGAGIAMDRCVDFRPRDAGDRERRRRQA
jgi:hypothetical protein